MTKKHIIAVSGASGFIGSALTRELGKHGYEVWPLVRKNNHRPHEIFYDYREKTIEIDKLKNCSAVIHLAGKNIFSGLWSEKTRRELQDSRIKSTRFIAQTLAQMEQGPKTLINASAIGYYGDRGDQKLDESSTHGRGFLADLCVKWEKAAMLAHDAGIRVVRIRIGAVLNKDGGMLKTMLPAFKMGLGGPLGSGAQFVSYISLTDLIAAIIFCLKNDDISGPVNLVAPEPVTNKEFATSLAKALKRPSFFKAPAFLFKLLGELGDVALFSSRVYPRVLEKHGFTFKDQNLARFLQDHLNETRGK